MDDAIVKGSSYETRDCESADYPCGGVEGGIREGARVTALLDFMVLGK